MASCSWGMEALILGNLIMLALGTWVSLPSSASASGTFCSSVKLSGKADKIRPARERSLVSTSTPAASVNVLTIGSKE